MKKWIWIPIFLLLILLISTLCKVWAGEMVSPLGITVTYDDGMDTAYWDLNSLDAHFMNIQSFHGGYLDPSRITLRTKEADCINDRGAMGYSYHNGWCVQAQWLNKYTFNHHMGNDSGSFCGSAWWWELNRSFIKQSRDKFKKSCWAWEGNNPKRDYCGQYFYNPCQ